MSKPLALLLAALLLLSACGSDEAPDEPEPVPDGWAVLDEGTAIYVRLGHIRWELERKCMEDEGFDVHPVHDEQRLADWRPVDREPPVLAPSIEEARQVGLVTPDPLLPAPAPTDPFNLESQDYRDRYIDAYTGDPLAAFDGSYGVPEEGSCVARVHQDMFGEAPASAAWQPIPVPIAFDWSARWAMYYAIPAVVTAAASWRACLEGKGHKAFETIDDARDAWGRITGDQKRRDFAVDVATCVDAAGWREIHTESWRAAVDRLVTEQLPQIRSWRADLARVVDDAEDLLGE